MLDVSTCLFLKHPPPSSGKSNPMLLENDQGKEFDMMAERFLVFRKELETMVFFVFLLCTPEKFHWNGRSLTLFVDGLVD